MHARALIHNETFLRVTPSAPRSTPLARPTSKNLKFQMQAPVASGEGEAPIAIPARLYSTEELHREFRKARHSYNLAWVQHNILLRDNEHNPHFDETRSPFIETMAWFGARMNFYGEQLAERGEVVPSRWCTVTSLFLEEEQAPAAIAGAEIEAPVRDAQQEEDIGDIPLRASLEASWNCIDAAYMRAWVEQHLFLEDNPDATDAEVTNTPYTEQMLIRGRALEIVERRLQAMGWQRPPSRMVNALFPVLGHRVDL